MVGHVNRPEECGRREYPHTGKTHCGPRTLGTRKIFELLALSYGTSSLDPVLRPIVPLGMTTFL